MRVLILATDIYTRGGIARYTATLAEGLGQLLGPENVDVLPLLGAAGARLDASSVRVFDPTTERLTWRAKIRHAARAVACGRSGYDLAICSHLALAPLAALIRLRYGTPYLVVCHGSEAWQRLPTTKRAALRRAHSVLAVSAYTAGAVCRANELRQESVRVLYNAIPEDLVRRLTGPEPEQRARTGPMLLSVGSLNGEHAYKGVDTVIAALPQILAAVPEARYVVAGSGDDRANLERLAASLGVRERLTFAGEVSDRELVNLYRACDVFVLPSRASLAGRCEGEGFGRVYVEAALAGRPVVGSRDGGAAEAVLDGRTGLLVDPRSSREVADAVVRVLKAPQWAQSLGAEGRRWALENFTVPVMQRGLRDTLDSLEVVGGRLPVVGSSVVSGQLLNHERRTAIDRPATD